ncbi:hypothetical protein ESCOCP333M_13060 [Escherichia coli]
MNELISNDLTGARMTTIDIMNLLNANLPANKKHPYDHFEIIKKVEDLMRMNIIHLRKKSKLIIIKHLAITLRSEVMSL